MIHSVFTIQTTLILLLICAIVAYVSSKRGDLFWTLGAIGFAVFMFWPAWPNEAYQAIKNFFTVDPEGAALLASLVFLVVVAWGCKHVFFGDKRTKHRSWF